MSKIGIAPTERMKTETSLYENSSDETKSELNLDPDMSTENMDTTLVPNNLDFRSPKTEHKHVSWYERQDICLWFAGMIFIVILLGMIAVVGNARGWNADTSYEHNDTETSQDRFQNEPYTEEPGVRGRYGKDCVARWYYWKLKPELISTGTRAFAWIGFSLHLAFIWGITYYAQLKKAEEPLGPSRYSTDLKYYNYIAFGVNAIFHLLHFICTHVTYDGLAQDVSMSTSQGSVTMALCLVILLEYKERGIFFGWPTTRDTGKISKKMRWDYAPINIIRRYHGYAIGWAAIYTCWYHPMENTLGHLMGFFYTWIIMLQGSLMYTELHLNKFWRLTQEAWVIVHSGVIAAQTGGPDLDGTRLWPRFVFGFSLAFVVTQIFSLNFWYKISVWFRFVPLALYLAVTLWAYSWIPDENGDPWTRLPEIFTVPSSYYIFFVLGWILFWAWLKVERRVYGRNIAVTETPLSPCKQALYLGSAVFIYGLHVALAIICEYTDWIAGLVVLMLCFVTIFMIGNSIACMFLRRAIPLRIKQDKIIPNDYDKHAFKSKPPVMISNGTTSIKDKEHFENHVINDEEINQDTKF